MAVMVGANIWRCRFKSKWNFLTILVPMKKISWFGGRLVMGVLGFLAMDPLLAQSIRGTRSDGLISMDSLMFKQLFDLSLTDGHAYKRLGELCKGVGPRLSGSDNAERGIVWAVDMLKSMVDKVLRLVAMQILRVVMVITNVAAMSIFGEVVQLMVK
jgi:hypothetical protein